MAAPWSSSSLPPVLFLLLLHIHLSHSAFLLLRNQHRSHHSPSRGPVFSGNQTACNIFSGGWVSDDSYPLYQYSSCPAIDPTFNCQRFGRPDSGYQRYRWRPTSCELPRCGFPSSSSVRCFVTVGSWVASKNGVFVCRFDALYFLSSLRGKTILFVGDSLSRDQWESLLCLLTPSLSPSETQFVRGDVFSTFKALVSIQKIASLWVIFYLICWLFNSVQL